MKQSVPSDAPASNPRASSCRRPGSLWWLALPIVPLQAMWLKRTIARFPDAEGMSGSLGFGSRRLKVVALGDSVTAGYAVAHHHSSVAGQLAARLAGRYAATVDWAVCARTGSTAAEAISLVSPDVLADADLVFVSAGVNDLKNLHSVARFERDLAALLDAVIAAAPGAQVCWLGIPPLDHFPAFPRPLADVLGWRGRAFDAVGLATVQMRVRAFRIQSDGPLSAQMFGPDGFHPSETLHAAFADGRRSCKGERMHPIGRVLAGTCAFRLMPGDELAEAPSTAVMSRLGSGAISLAYTWAHATDGEQRGGVVVGSPGEDGLVEAAWFDSWHQQPALMRLTGAGAETGVTVAGTYAEEWGWTIAIADHGDTVRMTMCNVVPESALAQLPADGPPLTAGPYAVMVAEWTARSA